MTQGAAVVAIQQTLQTLHFQLVLPLLSTHLLLQLSDQSLLLLQLVLLPLVVFPALFQLVPCHGSQLAVFFQQGDLLPYLPIPPCLSLHLLSQRHYLTLLLQQLSVHLFLLLLQTQLLQLLHLLCQSMTLSLLLANPVLLLFPLLSLSQILLLELFLPLSLGQKSP